MNKENLYVIGLSILVIAFFMMLFNERFYPPEIKETYQECDSWCIRENGTSPCNCREITEEKSTVPLWYTIALIALVIGGLVAMLIGWVNR